MLRQLIGDSFNRQRQSLVPGLKLGANRFAQRIDQKPLNGFELNGGKEVGHGWEFQISDC